MNEDLQAGVIPPHMTGLPTTGTACQDVVRFVYEAIDGGRASDAVAAYTEDAVFETARGGRMAGIEAISAVMAARQADTGRVTRHVLADLRVTTAGEAEARLLGTLNVFVLSGPSPNDPEVRSALDIQLSLREGAWRIRRHSSTRLTNEDPR
ncbi:SgcJ/EcaC family oxidoreductase [Streptomyces justiciae]|uniref:SgcJ/EcaC family oxidoreductase n=1 Tax=Streptomyces justiciae TaxID=2780140 RepID=UPI002117CBF7|nr:SgcJ/EcaC family oxidoreductase [Streptomyces justiciae]MCW8378652.1 nuclear transport factor 2 family protein [Streptomyces justiciae]